MGLSFDILIFDCLLKAPQPITGLFFLSKFRFILIFHTINVFSISNNILATNHIIKNIFDNSKGGHGQMGQKCQN